jgi:hypothetical protein
VYKGDTAVGPIGDVLIFLDHASVTAVVLSVDGFLGLREKLIAVPVSQIKVSSEEIHNRADQGTACGCPRIRLWQA